MAQTRLRTAIHLTKNIDRLDQIKGTVMASRDRRNSC